MNKGVKRPNLIGAMFRAIHDRLHFRLNCSVSNVQSDKAGSSFCTCSRSSVRNQGKSRQNQDKIRRNQCKASPTSVQKRCDVGNEVSVHFQSGLETSGRCDQIQCNTTTTLKQRLNTHSSKDNLVRCHRTVRHKALEWRLEQTLKPRQFGQVLSHTSNIEKLK